MAFFGNFALPLNLLADSTALLELAMDLSLRFLAFFTADNDTPQEIEKNVVFFHFIVRSSTFSLK